MKSYVIIFESGEKLEIKAKSKGQAYRLMIQKHPEYQAKDIMKISLQS